MDIEKKAALARAVMSQVNPNLVEQFVTLTRFLHENPDAGARRRKSDAHKTEEELIHQLAKKFSDSRKPIAPSKPETVPDELVSLILKEYFNVPEESLERAKDEHQLSMAAENMVGNLLERFIASKLEARGWVWCSGSMVKAADFIKPPSNDDEWTVLQVKNRDNSENSSSSAIRNGTKIRHWFRTFSRREATNWPEFPESEFRDELTETEFLRFVKNYLRQLN